MSFWDLSGKLIAAALRSSPRGTQAEETEGVKQESAEATRNPVVYVQLDTKTRNQQGPNTGLRFMESST